MYVYVFMRNSLPSLDSSYVNGGGVIISNLDLIHNKQLLCISEICSIYDYVAIFSWLKHHTGTNLIKRTIYVLEVLSFITFLHFTFYILSQIYVYIALSPYDKYVCVPKFAIMIYNMLSFNQIITFDTL